MIRTDMLTSIYSTGGVDALPNAYRRFIILTPDNGGERINESTLNIRLCGRWRGV